MHACKGQSQGLARQVRLTEGLHPRMMSVLVAEARVPFISFERPTSAILAVCAQAPPLSETDAAGDMRLTVFS